MGPRAALILVALAAGCSAGNHGGGPVYDLSPPDDFGPPMDFSSANTAVSVGSDSATAPATLTASAVVPFGAAQPTWSVLWSGNSRGSYTPTPVPGSGGLSVTYSAQQPGTYTFYVSFAGNRPPPGMASVTVGNAAGQRTPYRVRVSPPEALHLPQQDFPLLATGGTAIVNYDLTLLGGGRLSGTLRGPTPQSVPGDVRFLATDGPDAVATTDDSGHFETAVRLDVYYTPLLTPRSPSLAPHLGQSTLGSLLVANGSYVVSAGAAVSGTVSAGGQPLAGARVLLRSGPLPSSLGTSAADGSFTLRAEPGRYQVSVSADGWPEIDLGDVDVPAGGTTLACAIDDTRFGLAGTVLRPDGTSAAAGARVTLTAAAGSGSIAVAGGSPRAAGGRVAIVVYADGAGHLPSLALPAGSYDVYVEPAAGSSDGATAFTRAHASAGDAWSLVLAPRLSLGGTVRTSTGATVAGARVTAVETRGLGRAPVAISDDLGRYTLAIDPGTPVALHVEPPATLSLADARLTLAAGTTHADVALAPGLQFSGHVRGLGSSPIANALLEASCVTCPPEVPAARGSSDATGYFRLYLPDPGPLAPDGGAGN